MNQYKLIAFDMDGTLLNSKKRIDKETSIAIHEAKIAGKEIVLCTGRSVAELREFYDDIPDVRYYICSSGALIYDVYEKRVIDATPLPESVIKDILSVCAYEDIMLQVQTVEMVIQENYLPLLDKYGMGSFAESYLKITLRSDDVISYVKENIQNVVKMNLYHRDTIARERTMQRISKLNSEIVYSELTSIECTASGVNKANGLNRLAKKLAIDNSEIIAVGDSDNDIPVLKAAGLSVAMGNAKENVKKISDIVVSDNDHFGCVEVIRKYLLN